MNARMYGYLGGQMDGRMGGYIDAAEVIIKKHKVWD